jgi:6-phosphogluconolactonase
VNLHVYSDARELSEAAAQMFVEEAQGRIDDSGRFTVAFAGGSTPKLTYEILAREYGRSKDLDWSKVHVFFGDERTVPPDHEDSNYRMASEALLTHVTLGSVYRMRGEMEPREAAALYEKKLEEFFGGAPRLDLVLLGIGEDGHTASLFPRTPALDVYDRWAVENPVDKLDTVRLTLTISTINAARAVVFLVAGGGKAEALKEVLEGEADSHDYPAKCIQPVPEPVWMVDEAAARSLRGPV